MFFDKNVLELDKVLNRILPYCQTNVGKEEILKIEPINDVFNIKKMLDEIDEAYNLIVKLKEVPLGGLKNKKDAILRASLGGVLDCNDLYEIAMLLTTSKNVCKYYSDCKNLKVNLSNLSKYFDQIISNKKIEEEIYSSINEDLRVSDNASMTLFKIRKKLKMEETHLRNYMNSCLQSKSSMLQENLIAVRDGHFTLPVRAEYKNQIKGVVRDSSSSGTTYFIEPEEAYKISMQIENTKAEEKKEVEVILRGLSQLVASISDELLINFNNLILLDVIYAKANFALNNDMVKPIVNEDGIIDIKNGCHPLIDKDIVVKNDVSLGKTYSTIIITGPNTGGKTVLLKMVGLLTLMMQSGLFIPAKEGTILNVFDNVFSDIGDEQSIEQNLSTFSSHMTNISKIVDNLTYNSLVLLDEVGSGTDPKEGASLAIAIIDYLTSKGARVITTTHYSDLKAFAYNNKNIINASVEFKVDTLRPTYKLQIGVAGKSNALLISKRLGLNEKIIDKAFEIINESNSDTQTLINKIDEENEKISAIKEEYNHKINEYNNKLEELNREKLEIENNYSKIVNKASKEAKKILDEAKEKASTIIEELNSLKDEKYYEEHKLADAKYKVRNLNVKEDDNQVFDEEINVSDYVYIKKYQSVAQVKNIKNGIYEVMVGQFLMKFKKDELSLEKHVTNKPKTKPAIRKESHLVTQSSSAKMKIDLRGYRYEEVSDALDKFIDQAYLANIPCLYVVHGFGTGAVRDAVNSYLKKSSYVKSYRYGGEGEGLNGCTVVYLK